jgi:hypothetical protein
LISSDDTEKQNQSLFINNSTYAHVDIVNEGALFLVKATLLPRSKDEVDNLLVTHLLVFEGALVAKHDVMSYFHHH